MEDSRFQLTKMDRIEKVKLFEVQKEGLYPVKWDVVSKEQDILFQRTVRKLFDKDYESDVVLKLGEKKFHVHSIVLAQAPMIMKKIEEKWGGKDKTKKLVEIDLTKEITYPGHFIILLKYLYNGKLNFPEKGKEVEFLKTAKQLEMKTITDLAFAYMATYFTAVDACRLMTYAKKMGYKYLYEVCLKLMSVKMDKILSSDLIFKFSKDNMLGIIQNKNIGLDEFMIFKAVQKYCENYAKTKNLKFETVFKEFEPHIRWPLIDPHDMITSIVPLKLVQRKFIYESYKYNALSPYPELQTKFFKSNPRCEDRTGSGFSFKWEKKWGTFPSQYLTLRAKDSICKNIWTSSRATTWFGDKEIKKKGIYFFEYRILSTQNSSYLMLGIGDRNTVTTGQWLGNNQRGWCVYSSGGSKYHKSSSSSYMPPPKTGDLFGVILDFRSLIAGKIYFQLNGKAYPEAFNDVTPPVWPAITFYGVGDEVEIVKNPKIDRNWKKG